MKFSLTKSCIEGVLSIILSLIILESINNSDQILEKFSKFEKSLNIYNIIHLNVYWTLIKQIDYIYQIKFEIKENLSVMDLDIYYNCINDLLKHKINYIVINPKNEIIYLCFEKCIRDINGIVIDINQLIYNMERLYIKRMFLCFRIEPQIHRIKSYYNNLNKLI